MTPCERTTFLSSIQIAIWVLHCVYGDVESGRIPRTAYIGAHDLGRPPDPEHPDRAQKTYLKYSQQELNGSTSETDPDMQWHAPDQIVNDSHRRGHGQWSNASYDVTGVFHTSIRVFTMDVNCRNFEFVVSVIFVGITCLFGFVGNILSILTLRRDSIKSVTTFLLSALAVADFTFLVPAVFVIMIPTYCEYSQHCVDSLLLIIPVFEQYGWAITSTCHTCTVYVTVLVAIHRYLWVCRLHIAQRLSGLRRVKIQVALVPLCALLYNSPRFFEYRIVHYAWNDTLSADDSTIRRETTKMLADVGRNNIFQIGYKNLLFFIIMYVIPLAILIMVSVNLIKTLKKRRATLQRIGSTSSNSASQARRDDNITFVLIIIIAAFIICQTPLMVQRLMLAVSGSSEELSCGSFYFYFEHIADYLALLNSSTNFVIYILFSPHFRLTLMADVLCKRGRTGNSGLRMSSVRTRKLPSDERNAMALLEMLPNNINAIALTALTGHVAAGVCGMGQQHMAAGTENNWLLKPEVNDQSGNFLSHSSQTTHQEMLTVSQDDPRNKDGESGNKTSDVLQSEASDTEPHVVNKNIQIPLIALEQASSQST